MAYDYSGALTNHYFGLDCGSDGYNEIVALSLSNLPGK
jgi:hypothetical protein